MCCGGGLPEGNSQHGVIYALRIREETLFSFEKEVYLYQTEVVGWMRIDRISTDWFESADHHNRL